MPKRKASRHNMSSLESPGMANLPKHVMCLKKTVFWDEFKAKLMLDRLTKQGVKMRAYQCPNCLQWHLTTKEEGRSKKTNAHKNASTKSVG